MKTLGLLFVISTLVGALWWMFFKDIQTWTQLKEEIKLLFIKGSK